MKLNKYVIEQWIEDIEDPDIELVFDMQYDCVQIGQELHGDPLLYLVYRHADWDDMKGTVAGLVEWYDTRVMTLFPWASKLTGIPEKDLEELIYPSTNYTSRIGAKQFLFVLRNYVKTKAHVVEWAPIYEILD